MRRIIAIIVFLWGCLAASAAFAQGDVYVQGYYRSDGTYVQPHFRSAPNNSVLDNWSTRGNVNPYTGQLGTRNPYTIQNWPPYVPLLPQGRNSPLYPGPIKNAPTYGYQ